MACQAEPHPMVIFLYPFLFLTLQSISYFKEDLGDIRSSTSMNIFKRNHINYVYIYKEGLIS